MPSESMYCVQCDKDLGEVEYPGEGEYVEERECDRCGNTTQYKFKSGEFARQKIIADD